MVRFAVRSGMQFSGSLLRCLRSPSRLRELVAAARRLPTTPSKWRAARDDRLARGERGIDQAWYLTTYLDIAAAGADPVQHYLRFGWREGRDPRPDFSTRGYLAAHAEVARARQNPLIHYLRDSLASTGKGDEALARGERGVDQGWYRTTYPDIAAAGVDPVHHYLQIGWREGRDPRPDFSTRGYLAEHEEIVPARQNPFIHSLREDELARGKRGVDQAWYRATYPDIAVAGIDPVHHYLEFGWREGRDPRPDFSTRGYLAVHDEVAGSGQNPLVHYLRHGGRKGPPRGGAPASWHWLTDGLGRMARTREWWDYKLVPILSTFYATALAGC
jgi:hypothetical protein